MPRHGDNEDLGKQWREEDDYEDRVKEAARRIRIALAEDTEPSIADVRMVAEWLR